MSRRLSPLLGLILALFCGALAKAATCPTYPYTLTNGTTADANQVMANFGSILNCVNNNIPILTTPVAVSQGGTGVTTTGAIVTLLGGPWLTPSNNLSDVASPSTSLTNLGGAPLASPIFTGTPTAPTPSTADNSTKLATTAYVQANLPVASTLYAEFRNQQTSGTASGEVLSGTSWNQRVLNTSVSNTISGVTLSGNQIVGLPAGTYQVTATAQAQISSNNTAAEHRLRIRDITDTTTLVVGQNYGILTSANTPITVTASLNGIFVIAGTKTIELDSWVATLSNGGQQTSTGEVEVYSDILLRKIG